MPPLHQGPLPSPARAPLLHLLFGPNTSCNAARPHSQASGLGQPLPRTNHRILGMFLRLGPGQPSMGETQYPSASQNSDLMTEPAGPQHPSPLPHKPQEPEGGHRGTSAPSWVPLPPLRWRVPLLGRSAVMRKGFPTGSPPSSSALWATDLPAPHSWTAAPEPEPGLPALSCQGCACQP